MKLKFVSLNLWLGGMLFDSIVEFLKQEDADIIVLQEVNNSPDPKLPNHCRSLEALQAELGYEFQDFAQTFTNKYPWGIIPEGNAVLSRFPIKSSGVSFFDYQSDGTPRDPFDPAAYPTTPRNLEHVALETPAGEVNVFNLQGVWDLTGEHVSPQREKMRDVILHKIEGKQNVIVAGDTNAKNINPVMQDIEKHLTNVFGGTLETTFNMRRKDNPGYATAVVDMIYISPDIKVLDKSCPDVDISDHLPLITTLELPHK